MEKDAEIKVRLPKETKEEFTRRAKRKALNPSEWLRQQIEGFIKEDQKNN